MDTMTFHEILNEAASFFFDPTIVMCVAGVSSVMLFIVILCGMDMRKEIDALHEEVRKKKVEMGHVEMKLVLATRLPLYVEDQQPNEVREVPLARECWHEYTVCVEPSLAERYAEVAKLIKSPSNYQNFQILLDTSEGVFIHTFYGSPDVTLNDGKSYEARVRFDPILVGKDIEIYEGFVCYNGWRWSEIGAQLCVEGDQLKFSYKVAGDS